MRNNPTTITTETIAESIVRGGHQVDAPDVTAPSVATVKERLDRIAQVTGVEKDHVKSSQAAQLIFDYEDKLKRGVYDTDATAVAV